MTRSETSQRSSVLSLPMLAFLLLLGGHTRAEQLNLICEYKEMTESASLHFSAVPREVEIDIAASRLAWNGSKMLVSAEITERWIRFEHAGFSYSISRVTGQIRFSNPSELARWKNYRGEMVAALMGQGYSASQAHAEVDRRLQSEFTAREHVGNCSPAASPKF